MNLTESEKIIYEYSKSRKITEEKSTVSASPIIKRITAFLKDIICGRDISEYGIYKTLTGSYTRTEQTAAYAENKRVEATKQAADACLCARINTII